jgi:AbrB family looped-hinge helix DNA binding protein
MISNESVVYSDGSIKVPENIRDYLGIVSGSKVLFLKDEDGRIYLQMEKPSARSVFENYKGKIDIDEESITELRGVV